MNTKSIYAILLFSLLFTHVFAQSDYYYYYKGQKVFLEVDRLTISLTIEGEADAVTPASLGLSSARLLPPVKDNARNMVITIDQKSTARKMLKTHYVEVQKDLLVNLTAYEKEIAALRSRSNVIMASPCFNLQKSIKIGLTNHLNVKLKNASDVNELYAQAEKLNLEVLGHNEYMPLWFRLSCGKTTKMNALDAANKLHETGLFAFSEPSFFVHDTPNTADPLYTSQWGLKNTGQQGGGSYHPDINVEAAWAITKGSPNIKVAVFDNGIEMTHPDLMGNIYGTGFDVVNNTPGSVIRSPHATCVAGIIAAIENTTGVVGVAPRTKLISVSKISGGDDENQIANGINWAVQNQADIISCSWGNWPQFQVIDDAIANALNNGRGGKGTVLVWSSGNFKDDRENYPSSSDPRIIVVGAMSPCGERKWPGSCDHEDWDSGYGPSLDIMAPGVKIATTDRVGAAGYTSTDNNMEFAGTSAACPFVSGVVALMLSANPNLTVQQVSDIIESKAQKVRSDLYTYATTSGRPNGTFHQYMGYGLVDAYAAVVEAGCAVNLTTNVTVTAPDIDRMKASNSIIATSVVNNGAQAYYHAGTFVKLSPGFQAKSGSIFRAYIEACSGTTALRVNTDLASTDSKPVNYQYKYLSDEPAAEGVIQSEFAIFPNPSTGLFDVKIPTTADQDAQVIVYDSFGTTIYQSPKGLASESTFGLNLGDRPNGLYIVHFKSGSSVSKTKIEVRK